MKQKLLYICLMILCTLAWSGEVWGQPAGYKNVTESKTVIINDTELQNMAGENGHTEGNVTFTINGNCSYESNGSCLNLGSVNKGSFTRNIVLAPQPNYTLSSISSVIVRAVGYGSKRYVNDKNVSTLTVNPQRSDDNYTDVTITSTSSPIVITCKGDYKGLSSHPFHINKVTITYSITHEEEILHTITIANRTGNTTTTAGVDTKGTATADEPAVGYEFLGWDIPETVTLTSGTSSSKTISFNATEDETITALYGKIHDVTVANNVDATTSIIKAGQIRTASATAESKTNYVFSDWDIPGFVTLASGYNNTSESITINATADNQTITARYRPVFKFSATALSNNEELGTASVSYDNEIIGTIGQNEQETTVTFAATPADDNCIFKGWYEANDYSDNPVSTSTSCSVKLKSSIGSSGTKTLYALFKKKQNLKWKDGLDFNLVKGATESAIATVSSDNTITYTLDPSTSSVIDIDEHGNIEAKEFGTVTITASVEGDATYDAESISHLFTVGERKQATFSPSWGESLTTSIEIGDDATIELTNVKTDETFSATLDTPGIIRWERNGNIITINALAAGSATLTLSQVGDGAFLNGKTTPYTITVTKHANTLAVAAGKKDMEVGDDWTSVVTADPRNDKPIQVSYTPEGSDNIATYDATNNKIIAKTVGTTRITFTQAETSTVAGATRFIDVTVSKVANTLFIDLPTREVNVDGTITPVIAENSQNNANTAISANITNHHQTSNVNEGTDVIVFEDGVIKAKNAGTATITLYQAETAKYEASQNFTFNVTVSKIANAITVTLNDEERNSINVALGDKVTLNYSSESDGAFEVALTSGSTSTATLSDNTITAGDTDDADGVNIWTITQAETYKYEAAETTFSIKVNSTIEGKSYLHESLTKENENHSWNWGVGNDYEISVNYIPTKIFFNAWHESGGVSESVTLTWKDANGNVLGSQSFSISTKSETKRVEVLPENARKFSISASGTLHQYISDVYVERKTYINAFSYQTNLGKVYTDKTGNATLTVEWGSSNGGDITIEEKNHNPRFSFSPNPVPVTANSNGTSSVTLIYTPDPDVLTPEEATIIISDKFHSSEEIPIKVQAQKYSTTIVRGTNTTETTVDGTISNAFSFSGTTTDKPSANSNADFYYEISYARSSTVNNGTSVISYDPETNTIKGLDAGTATITFIQKKTNLYNRTEQSFNFTVTKRTNNVGIALSSSTMSVDGTVTVQLTKNESQGALSASYSNESYGYEDYREGGLLSFSDGTLTGVNAGTATVTITQAETYKYVAKSATFDVTVNKLTQTLRWDNPDLETGMQVNTTLSGNTATSDVGLTPVTYASNSTAIKVDASTGVLTAVDTGSGISITASQAGNYKYLPATLSRTFSVFNKHVPVFTPDAHFVGTDGELEQTCTATITVTGVSSGSDFSITGYDSNVVSVVRDEETITIIGLAVGTTSITLTQTTNDDYLGKTQTYNIEVFWPDDFLALSPSSAPSDNIAGTYRKVFFNRSFNAGYSTIALPFNTTLYELTGQQSAEDWVAQLSVVTYTAADNGYTLYFKKTGNGADADGGIIEANRPYVLHLSEGVENPVWLNQEVLATSTSYAVQAEKGYLNNDNDKYSAWKMRANYKPGESMNGRYGIVNNAHLADDLDPEHPDESEKTRFPDGCLKLGGNGSTLNAFMAYIEGPTSAPVKAAYLDDDDNADGLLELLTGENIDSSTESVYDLQGRKLPKAQRGLNIIRGADGSVKKVMNN